MKVSINAIARVLAKETLEPDLKLTHFSREVAAYLLDTRQTGQLDSLARDMIRDRVGNGIVEVTVVSAHELSTGVLTNVKTQIKVLYPAAKHIIINNRYDSDLIGGIRIEFPDRQLDLSIRGKLNRFKALTTIT